MNWRGVFGTCVTLLFVSAGLAGAVCTGKVFSDVNPSTVSPEFCEAIETLANIAVVQGFPDGTYRPHNGVTRGAMAAFFTRTINHFGGVSVAPSRAPRTNVINTVDPVGNRGFASSIAIGADGFPVISYRDYDTGELRVAKCGDLACSPGLVSTAAIDTGDVWATSLTVGIDGFPVVSYYVQSSGDLKIAKCGDESCSPDLVIRRTIDGDSGTTVGDYTSITIGSDGSPVVSYYDLTNGNLKVARCNDPFCNTWNVAPVDPSPNNVGTNGTSIAIGTDGLPVISYYDATLGDLKVAKCNDASCFSATLTIADATAFPSCRTSMRRACT